MSRRKRNSKRSPSPRRLSVETLESRQLMATLASFDHAPTPYIQTGPNNLQFTSFRMGGPTGTFMKLAETGRTGVSALSFDRSEAGARDFVLAEFAFKVTSKSYKLDAFDFALLNTSRYGNFATRNGPDTGVGYANSLSIRFESGRTVDAAMDRYSSSFVQVIFNGQVIHDIDVNSVIDLAGHEWHRARILVNARSSEVTVELAPVGREPIIVADKLFVPGLDAYESRAHVATRGGFNEQDVDIDNVAVHFLNQGQSAFTFEKWLPTVTENQGPAKLTVRRFGDLSAPATINYKTENGNATAGADFTATQGAINWAAFQDTAELSVPIVDEFAYEANEYFWMRLLPTSAATSTADPISALVRVYDDEAGRDRGQFSQVMGLPDLAMHTTMLPTGKVMFWSRQHEHPPKLFDPVTKQVSDVAMPNDHHGTGEHFNVFCSGHTLLPDGRLFVAGGHEGVFVGLKSALIYDPFTDHWIRLPDMAGRRWYPTCIPLPNGDVLVLHGTIDSETNYNEQPEVWEAATNTWRKINIGQDMVDNHEAHKSNFYPKAFVQSDGRVFYFGKFGQTWFLDVRPGVTNPWTRGPQRVTGADPSDYGTVVEYAPGKFLVTGGGAPASSDAEVIDLNAANPQFRRVQSMTYQRRQHNATILSDGKVLITGGHDGVEYGAPVKSQKVAELWDPATERFKFMNSAAVDRFYHSTSLLLPDGSVFVGGGGEPATVPNGDDQRNAQIFQQPMLFYANRPEITYAPEKAGLGQRIFVKGNRVWEVNYASLVRLSSSTHTLEQSARLIPAPVSRGAGGVFLDIPANQNTLTPGYYFLTLVDNRGVPSVSKIIQITQPTDQVYLAVAEGWARETNGDSKMVFNVTLSKAATAPVSMGYYTFAGTAQPGSDYVEAVGGWLIFNPGETFKTIEITLRGDLAKESDEWFYLELTSISPNVIGVKQQAVGVISDND
jgi:hypothetical protein